MIRLPKSTRKIVFLLLLWPICYLVHITTNLQTKLSAWTKPVVKVVVFCVLLFLIWRIFRNRISWNEILEILSTFSFWQLLACLVVILLMPFNWACEAKKWQLLVKDIQETGFRDAFKGVLLGTTLGNLSPLMLGDFVGRLRRFPNDVKLKGGTALLFGNGLQTFVLLLFGKLGHEIFLSTSSGVHELLIHTFINYGFVTLIAISFLFFFKIIRLPKYKYIDVITTVDNYSTSAILRMLGWAVLRQLTFTIQFVILLKVFDVNLSLIILIGLVSLIFIAKTIGATMGFFGDFFTRQLSATYFFSFYAVSLESVFISITFLWLINLFIPLLIGAFLVFQSPKKYPH